MFAEKNKTVTITTLIGKTCKIVGNIVTKESIRVDGHVVGNIETDTFVSITEGANVEGDIKGNELYVAGKVTGNINVSKVIELAKTAVITGDVVTAKLQVDTGAIFNGTSRMGENARNNESKNPTQKPNWLENK
ncbi:MAG: polymer-forming cytoskeletal protein [Candidatus Cloacimonetes bacterium]|nr:polymer-forming cytoskeletal protein [Candidatus Cloacimonadota bacterium]